MRRRAEVRAGVEVCMCSVRCYRSSSIFARELDGGPTLQAPTFSQSVEFCVITSNSDIRRTAISSVTVLQKTAVTHFIAGLRQACHNDAHGMALTSGTRLGPYEIQLPLGAGGMGEVYRERDTRLERIVAIKILPSHLSENPEARQRFEREARTISSLNHPNVCTLHDVGHQDGIDYLVMEYLDGETLADRLHKGPISAEQVLKYAIEICEGLEKAHRSGVVHRDLKPGNIMLTKTGAKLMDFGLAKTSVASPGATSGLTATLTTPVGSHPLTAQGTVVGTFQYMAPEQVEGKQADERSDVFALGAVLYEMVTGKRAFEGKTAASAMAAVLERDPASISSIQPTTPLTFERLVKTCLAKDPDDRWQTAHDVKLQLKQIAERGSQINAVAITSSSAAPTPQRSTAWAWGLAVIFALVAATALVMAYLASQKPQPILRVEI